MRGGRRSCFATQVAHKLHQAPKVTAPCIIIIVIIIFIMSLIIIIIIIIIRSHEKPNPALEPMGGGANPPNPLGGVGGPPSLPSP